jgi:hypothetical protein
MEMLQAGRIETRYGACQALIQFKGKASPAIPVLSESLDHDDLWLRVKAAEALGAIGDEAMPTVPKLLTRLAVGPTEEDPRGMEQRYLCFTLFNRRGGMLGRSLEGVDREALYEAVRAGLRNQDGRARGSLGTVYDHLTFEEIRPLLPSIHRAVVEPAPSGIMFADGIRLAGLKLLADNRIKEGIPLCLEVMEIDRWGKRNRIDRCLKAIDQYGGAAESILPELRQLEKDLLAHREAKGLASQIEQLREIIANLENTDESVELRSIDEL